MSLTKVTYSLITDAPINVKDFGAIGDGIADDSDAIISAAAAAENKILLNQVLHGLEKVKVSAVFSCKQHLLTM